MGTTYISLLVVALMLSISEEEPLNRTKRAWSPRPLLVNEHDLNVAVKVAQNFVNSLQRLEESLVGSDVSVREDSPSHGQLIDSYPAPDALPIGRHAFVATRASLYLVQRHCKKLRLSTADCIQAIGKFSLKVTPLGDKCTAQFGTVKCTASYHYRSYDGSCNHLLHPTWGQSFTVYKRLLQAQYADGIYEPRKSVNKGFLPSARLVSNLMVPDMDKPEKDVTLALVQWTQFIGNDMYHTPVSRMVHTSSSIECCRADGKHLSPRYIHPICQRITIPDEDPDYAPFRTTCMSYVRSLTSLREDCNFGPADQMNQATHYLDGSMVYGNTASKAISLRTMTGGRLATSIKGQQEYLAMSDSPENQCQIEDNVEVCFKSGDSRVNQHPHQTAMYTIWVREHNRIATALGDLNPHWDDETVYQEARKIVIAEIQHITYRYWVPYILGESHTRSINLDIKPKGFSNLFNEDENPSVSNSFATVAFRFINSMFQSQLRLYDEERAHNESILLKDNFNKPAVIQEVDVLDQLIRGMSTQTSQKMDTSFVEDVTSLLFKGANPIGYDIFSLDIQRGRDHGLPGYNHYRKLCGLPSNDQFETFTDTIPKPTLTKIQTLYNHPNDVDLIVGAIAEVPAGDGILGRTLRCIIGEQMTKARKGDRFFYDIGGKAHSFKEGQINEIKKTSLARILCDNSDGIRKMQVDVFKVPSTKNPLVDCSDSRIPKVNLNEWKSINK